MTNEANFEMLIARKRAGMTQTELAEAVGKSLNWIARIEKGKEKPTEDLANKIAGALNVDVDLLFNKKGQ